VSYNRPSDIVERLRDMHGGVPESYVGKLRAEAADEIERLRTERARVAAHLDQLADRLEWFMEYVNYKHDDEFGNASADCHAMAENLRK
jgi:hypothetical protein